MLVAQAASSSLMHGPESALQGMLGRVDMLPAYLYERAELGTVHGAAILCTVVQQA